MYMQRHILSPNNFLRSQVTAYYDCPYLRFDPNNSESFANRVSDAIRSLKNQYNNKTDRELMRARAYIRTIATTDLKELLSKENLRDPVIVCVPRSKADFTEKQLFFHKAISEAAKAVGVTDGTGYIKSTINTKTTHLANTRNGDMSGDGDMPYPGITNRTCKLNGYIYAKNVILVDDIYTRSVNIDEDCCQYLLDNRAESVILYTICKT